MSNSIIRDYKFIMSSFKDEPTFSRRTSERRRLKLLKKNEEFKMTNPYKLNRADSLFPQSLSRQLRKIDFLSASSIALLTLDPNCLPSCTDSIIENMKTALQEQQERFSNVFGRIMMQEKSKEEDSSCWLSKQENQPQLILTRQEISLNVYDPESNQDLFRGNTELLEEDQPAVMEEQIEGTGYAVDQPWALLQEDYQNYFLN